MKKVTFYFDGFNFYYGLRNKINRNPEWHGLMWIDIVKFCSYFLGPDQELTKVKYFTATPINVGKQSRQSAFFKANKLINGETFEIIRGKYYKKDKKCPLCYGDYKQPEEKRTDVNIATHLIGDCALNNTDTLVLISADSDLVPPIEFIKEHYPTKKVKIYFPPESFSKDLFNINRRKVGKLENNIVAFRNSLMPQKVFAEDGEGFATIPESWI